MEHSPYLAEHLIRHPKDIRHLKAIVEPSEDGDAPGGSFEDARTEGTRAGDVGPTTTSWDDRPEVRQVLETPGGLDEKSAWLRRFYRHEMLRILGAGIHLRQGIFHTLDRTSRLADWVIRAAYRFAAEDVFGGALPDSPRARMHVIALGRLGPREFDLGSDADLVFVLPAPAAGERRRWTQVAERLIEITSSYTREQAQRDEGRRAEGVDVMSAASGEASRSRDTAAIPWRELPEAGRPTLPLPVPARVIVRENSEAEGGSGSLRLKVALQSRLTVIVTWPAAHPGEPVKPAKTDPVSGVAVSGTTVPSG